MNRYRVHFRDTLHDRIDFWTTLEAKSMHDLNNEARKYIIMPDYVIATYSEVI